MTDIEFGHTTTSYEWLAVYDEHLESGGTIVFIINVQS